MRSSNGGVWTPEPSSEGSRRRILTRKRNTPAELKAKADEIELAGVNFYTPDGEYAFDNDEIEEVEFIFIDGGKILIGSEDVDACMEVRFTLRPAGNHS